MKKKVQTGFIIVMIFLYANSFSQTVELGSEKESNAKPSPKTYLDVVLNLVSTNIDYGSSNTALKDYKKSVLGAQVGVTFQAGITHQFSLVTELYFMMKGGKLNANNPLMKNESTLRFYTLELPVLARFHLGRFYMNAGPSLAYNIGGTNKMDNNSSDITFKNTTNGFKRFEAGMQIGGGYEFPFKHKRVSIDLRYNYGLTNISYDKEMYNRSFIVSIHFSKAWKVNPLAKHQAIKI